ncbi:hypothetical protein C8R45DRAFT_928336 [Mycena sanguinolenta]|nr:hypothetical protein C8R45DRAFT_928336 [Mycena sanguinolenta]
MRLIYKLFLGPHLSESMLYSLAVVIEANSQSSKGLHVILLWVRENGRGPWSASAEMQQGYPVCQTSDWYDCNLALHPTNTGDLNEYWRRQEHKTSCGATGIPKLVKTLLANPDLLVHLQGCFILAFDLINRARCNELFLARVDVAVEPTDIFNFAEIFLGLGEGSPSSMSASKRAVVNAFTPSTTPKQITDSHRAAWKHKRAMVDAAGFHADEEMVAEWKAEGFVKPTDADPTGKTTA